MAETQRVKYLPFGILKKNSHVFIDCVNRLGFTYCNYNANCEGLKVTVEASKK